MSRGKSQGEAADRKAIGAASQRWRALRWAALEPDELVLVALARVCPPAITRRADEIPEIIMGRRSAMKHEEVQAVAVRQEATVTVIRRPLRSRSQRISPSTVWNGALWRSCRWSAKSSDRTIAVVGRISVRINGDAS